jgi:transposase, IS5 family
MRLPFYRQTNFLDPTWLPLERSRELKALSAILDRNPSIIELIQRDLVADKSPVGAEGMSAEQVVRALLIQQQFGFSFRDLAFHLADSLTFRVFCRFREAQRPSKSALAAAFKQIRVETLQEVQRLIVGIGVSLGVEDGAKVRGDCTVTETPIHAPTDSSLLVDAIRVLSRKIEQAQKLLGEAGETTDVLGKAKRCGRAIATSRKGEERQDLYRDLIRWAHECFEKAHGMLQKLEALKRKSKSVHRLIKGFNRFLQLTKSVKAQAARRIFKGIATPSQEKVVSLFEDHTDVIKKSWNETLYGHKICLVTGKTLILASWVLSGNPADVTLTKTALEKTTQNLGGKVPQQTVFDGCFSSRSNLEDLRDLGVKDVVFSKHPGLKVSEMTKSPAVFQELRNFRAGIEGCISFLKRTFGLHRCPWRSFASFQAYVASATVACNLLLLARSQL